MKVGSLFSGYGGFDIAAEAVGAETTWLCEIDRDAKAILRRHFPGVPLHSDVQQIGAHNLTPVDVLVFGSPCQDLSVAGQRRGFKGERSSLFHEAVRIIRELRERDGRPRWAIWENVPGAFSSHRGRDFAAVLDSLLDIGARDIAWRVLDAQWHGVAQRRRRIFLVADFGGECAEAVLSVRESLSWHPPTRRAKRQVAAALPASGAGTSRTGNERTECELRVVHTPEIAWARSAHGGPLRPDLHLDTVVPDVAYSLTARNAQDRPESSAATRVAAEVPELSGSRGSHRTGGWGNDLDNQGAFIPVPAGPPVSGAASAKWAKGTGGPTGDETYNLLTVFTQEATPKGGQSAVPALDSAGCRRPSIAFTWQASNANPQEEAAPTRRVGAAGMGVAHALTVEGADASEDGTGRGTPIVPVAECVGTKRAHAGMPKHDADNTKLAHNSMSVRRLTPTECCRLMGIPDDWLDWGLDENGNRVEMSDSAKYRMAGNGLVPACVVPILRAIQEAIHEI